MKISTVYGPCSKCRRRTKLDVKAVEKIITVRKEPVKLNHLYARCTECGAEVIDPKQEADLPDRARRKYRDSHGLLQPEEIREWRKARGITQRELAGWLGLARATISRYENGSLQDASHDRLLRSVMIPSALLSSVEKSKDVFTEARKRSLVKALPKRQITS